MTCADNAEIDLFQAYPALLPQIPYLPLAALPTPLQTVHEFAGQHHIGGLHIKRDDQSSSLYGGNKTRKLGFLLAAARERGARTVITFGAAGSNHALATALHAHEQGLKALLVLGPQHNSHHVRLNLRAMRQAGATLQPCHWKETAAVAAKRFHEIWRQDGAPPYGIPPGGSSPVGVLGFVNAAFELGRQVAAGNLPEPDLLYVASGTMGTCVGLALGLHALGMKTRVMAVRVTQAPYTSMTHANALFDAANALLRRADASFPLCQLDDARFCIRDEYFGRDYAWFTPEGMAAIDIAQTHLSMTLEGAYTGKAFAALLGDAASGMLRNSNVVFWNTYSGGAPHACNVPFDYCALPEALHTYFVSPTQPLDSNIS